MKMPFGKYADWELEDIPESYLLWAFDNIQFRSPTLKRAIADQLGIDFDEDDEPPPSSWKQRATGGGSSSRSATAPPTSDVADRWLKSMSRKFHPDRGGTTEVMQAVMEGFELLKQMVGGKA